MKWKKTENELPPLHETTRCLAYVKTPKWAGYMDVYFSPFIGWSKSENDEPVFVLAWIALDHAIHEIVS